MNIKIELDDITSCYGCPFFVWVKYPGRNHKNPGCSGGFMGEQGTGYKNEIKTVYRPKGCIEKHGE